MKITGSAYEKYGRYYLAVRVTFNDGSKKVFTKATNISCKKLKVKGEEKRVESYYRKALERLAEFKKEIMKKKEILENMESENSETSFSAYAKKYLERRRCVWEFSTYLGTSRAVINRIIPFFKGKKLSEITVSDIKEFQTFLRKKGLSENTVKHYTTYLRSILNEAIEDGIIAKNVVHKLKPIKVLQKERTIFKTEELKVILEKIKETDLEIPVLLGLKYGLRVSETIGLRWQDINFFTNKIYIKNTVTKGLNFDNKKEREKEEFLAKEKTKTVSSQRSFFLDENLKKILEEKLKKIEYKKKELGNTYNAKWLDYIVVSDEGKLYKQMSRHFTDLLRENGILKGSFMNLRTTFATVLFEKKVDIITIKELMGHSNIETTIKYYIKYNEEIKRETLELLNFYIENLSEKKEELSNNL